MKIGFVINELETELPVYTSTRLELRATALGHEVWVMGAADFACDPDGSVSARARSVVSGRHRSHARYLDELRSSDARQERIAVDQLDVLMLRYDPAEDTTKRPWAQAAPILFAQLCKSRGVLVLNDPHSLVNALNKTYFQHFPEEVRPKTLITRDAVEIKSFIEACGGHAVVKPLQGSGGRSVFLARPESKNVNQMIEAVARDGYVVCQEYLRDAEHGDTRLFVLNGRALMHQGEYCAFCRVGADDDVRSNMHAGGKVRPAEIGERELRIVELVRPKLVADGMFLVGLDIVGDKLMEVNVFSPGGLGSAQTLRGVNFTSAIIEAIEDELAARKGGQSAQSRAGAGKLPARAWRRRRATPTRPPPTAAQGA
jgi:glutathione synthase